MSKLNQRCWVGTLHLAAAVLLTGFSVPVLGDGTSTSNVHLFWNAERVVGQSTLHRSDEGLKGSFKINANATETDQALTLWIVVFNYPNGCATSPCTGADLFNPLAEGDFLYGGGVISTGKKLEFGGSLETGDASGSGFIEFGVDPLAIGLTDPWNAEVHFALHSHGPAGSGDVLKAQLSSFFGGCTVFLGPDGFAAGPEDVPDEVGECSTTMISIHQP